MPFITTTETNLDSIPLEIWEQLLVPELKPGMSLESWEHDLLEHTGEA